MQCRVAIAVLLLLLLPLLMSKSNRCLFESAYHRMWKTIVELRLLLLLQSIAVVASLFDITFVRLHFNIFLQLESRALEYTHRHRHRHNTQAQAYNHIETSHARDRKINRRRAKEITLNSLVFRFCLICTHFLYFSCASFLF